MTEKRNHLHLVSDDTEYKDYALSVLDDAIYDAIISDADEYDIYNCIMNAIRSRGSHHQLAADRCKKLSDLLEGEITKDNNFNEPDPAYNPKEWD
jgi:hypothetical protein|tara:strand:- start:31733 stop:32017 length:285 start_codon:yes stop_codon:yes gene_type:complete